MPLKPSLFDYILELLSDDVYASSFQSLAQYRSAILNRIKLYDSDN